MASYESEHASDPPKDPEAHPRRPDLSTFLNLLSQISSDPSQRRTREHAVPVPADISATYRSLAEAFNVMRRDNENADPDLLESMIENLMHSAETPPTDVKGVDEEYISNLERVNMKKVKKGAECPICGERFSDDPHPLLVRLPCHPNHIFDLECISPWLRLNGTCPLDRADLAKRERERKKRHLEDIKKNAAPEDEEEEWDGLYG